MDELKDRIRKLIIEKLRLEVKPEEIKDDQPLFGEGLGLDSIDALELIVLLEKNYGIKIEDPKDGRKVFYSVDTMADFIRQHQSN